MKTHTAPKVPKRLNDNRLSRCVLLHVVDSFDQETYRKAEDEARDAQNKKLAHALFLRSVRTIIDGRCTYSCLPQPIVYCIGAFWIRVGCAYLAEGLSSTGSPREVVVERSGSNEL